MNRLELTAEEAGIRLDRYLSTCTDLSRSRLQMLIEEGNVTVNGKPVKSSYKTEAGDRIEVLVPEAVPVEMKPENIPLDILYEDSDVIVINKPKGMVVHPAPG
ncbi:MAG: RNA pseudouridine synthase, partial [Solobacterium sp.]|nr:RNA pseudouridine synthase [Solobacterium sp.]